MLRISVACYAVHGIVAARIYSLPQRRKI